MAHQPELMQSSPIVPFRLLDLPQELQDMIFDYAYPEELNADWTGPQSWDYRERENRKKFGPAYSRRLFPDHKVSEWLVSKRYFTSAAKAWVQNQYFHADQHEDILREPRGVWTEWATRLRTSSSGCRHVSWMPNLRVLIVGVHHFEFDHIGESEDRFPWESRFDEEDFIGTRLFQYLKGVRGLQNIWLEARSIYGIAQSEEASVIWETNVRALEDFIRPLVTSPKQHLVATDDETLIDEPVPLYSGSRVYFNAPMALDEVEDTRQYTAPTEHLRDQDIPDDAYDLERLMSRNPSAVLGWIKRAKVRLLYMAASIDVGRRMHRECNLVQHETSD